MHNKYVLEYIELYLLKWNSLSLIVRVTLKSKHQQNFFVIPYKAYLLWKDLHTELCFLFSPLFAQTSSRSSDSLARLYEMDDHPERRVFLDKLLSFMEEKGTPITQCPTISKNPLDLFRLYLYTKERGGYLEVSHWSALW